MDEQTATTQQPAQDVELEDTRLTKEQRRILGVVLQDAVENALAARSILDQALDEWNDMYEMAVGEKDFPFEDSANLFVPMVPTILETLQAHLAGEMFVERLYLVTGNTPDAADTAPDVERYYNTELWRQGWLEAFLSNVQLSLRDGGSATEVVWERREVRQNVKLIVPDLDPATRLPQWDELPSPENPTGKIKTKIEESSVTVIEHDDVVVTDVELRDIGVIPSDSPDMDKAPGVWRRLYLVESELRALVNSKDNPDGPLFADAVDDIIKYVQQGESERPSDPQGTATYQVGGRVQPQTQVMEPATDVIGVQRGPYRMFRIHTDYIDLDGDGTPEENVIWVHEQSRIVAGYTRYDYWHRQRPFSMLVFLPRPKRFYGFSVIERLASGQVEVNALRNNRLDWWSIVLNPPIRRTPGAKIKKKGGGSLYPGAEIEANSGDIEILTWQNPQILEASQAEGEIRADNEKMFGMSDPATGAVGASGRRTAKEVTSAQAARTVRLGLMAIRGRNWLKRVFRQIHELKIQFQRDQTTTTSIGGVPEKLFIPREVLRKDYSLDIAGIGGPLDKSSRLQEYMFLYGQMMKDPDIAQDPVYRYRFRRMLLEAFELPDVIALIGTEQEAEQRKQQQQQMQEAQMKMMQAQAAAGAGGQPGAPGGGQPAAGAAGAGGNGARQPAAAGAGMPGGGPGGMPGM